jgi:hypothetical protein
MAYGIQIFGSDSGGEFLQVDSTLDLVQYVVSHYGVGSSVDIGNVSALDRLVFVRGQDDGFTGGDIICYGDSGSTITFTQPDNTAAGAPIVVEYMVAVDVAGVTSTGGYGLQVLTAAGAVAFDTTRYIQNKGFSIVEYVEPFTIDGIGSVITTDPSLFVEIGIWSFFNSSDPIEENYAGAEFRSGSIRHWDLEGQEEGQDREEYTVQYYDNSFTILLADTYP